MSCATRSARPRAAGQRPPWKEPSWRARAGAVLTVAALVLGGPRTAHAWIFPEHADIAEAAIRRLSPEARAFYHELWAAAHAAGACTELAVADQGTSPRCIDFAAWSAIAGDHSCSPVELVDDVVGSPWIMDVARYAAVAKERLARARSEREILDAWAASDLGLERADASYSARAVTNNSHFLLARATNDVVAYATTSIAPDADLNAFGLVVAYQLGAVRLAHAWRAADAGARSALARQILATEAFALHFLEDSFAAGHAAGTWGDAASRKGTHDYYCTHGLDTNTWRGAPATLFGDAHMKPADLERTSRAVAASLSQVYEASRDGSPLAANVTRISWAQAQRATTLSSCRERKMGAAGIDRASLPILADVLLDTPYPAQAETGAPLPRFRAELGPFVGVYSSGRIASAANGYTSSRLRPRPVGSLDLGARAGIGLERLVGASGLIFVQAGIVNESAQIERCSSGDCTGDYRLDSLLPEVPARVGLGFRLHLPFWLVPGDLLVAGPVVALVSFQAFKQMAILAGGGGLIPWQSDIRTALGTFQFVVGRDVGLTMYGYLNGPSVAVTPTLKDAQGQQQYGIVELRTVELEFPILEYRPFHEFAMRQAFTMAVQLGYAVDIPSTTNLIAAPDIPPLVLTPSHMLTLRLMFDVRHYL